MPTISARAHGTYTWFILFALAALFMIRCSSPQPLIPSPTAPVPRATISASRTPIPSSTATETATVTVAPTATSSLTLASTPSPPTPTPTEVPPTRPPTETPTPVGNYVEAQPAGVISLYGGDWNPSTAPSTEFNYQRSMERTEIGFLRPKFNAFTLVPDLGKENYLKLVNMQSVPSFRVTYPFPNVYAFKATRAGSEVMRVPVKLNDGSTKIASVIQIDATTFDSKGKPVDVLIQLDVEALAFVNVGRTVDNFYPDPALPHPKAGIIRVGDIFAFGSGGNPWAVIENANSKKVSVYTYAYTLLFPNARIN